MANSLRIGVLTTSFPRFEGDYAGSFINLLLQSLCKKKFYISVLAPSDFTSQRLAAVRGTNVKRFSYFFPRRLQRLTYNFGILTNLNKNPLAIFQLPSFLLIYFWHSFILSMRSDILWSHWIIPSGIIGTILKKITKKKHLLTVHSSGGLNLLSHFPLKMHIISFIVKNTDLITCVSSYLQNRLLELLPPELRKTAKMKFHILPMGVELNQNGSRNKWPLRRKHDINSKHLILFIGRLDRIKGISYLIKAMQWIEDTALIIAGEGELRENLMNLAKEIEVRVRFVGLLNGQVKSDYFSRCDAVIVPSISLNSGRKESAPVVILEAFAHAKPVLASNVGGICELVENGHNGLLFEEKNPRAIAEMVNNLLNNKEKLKQMSRNAFHSAERFDINIIGKKYEKIIDQL